MFQPEPSPGFEVKVTVGDLVTWLTIVFAVIRYSNRIAIMESRVSAMWKDFLGRIGVRAVQHKRRETDT